MKGIVFTEFMDMVEQRWGIDMVDELIEAVNPESGGSYTSVGTYDFDELIAYVVEINRKTDIEVAQLVRTFGHHMAKSFSVKFHEFFASESSTFSFLKKIDNHIHVEVQKLYPDAELPKFSYEETDAHTLVLRYESSRNLPDLAHGLIEGSAEYFDESINITRQGETIEGIRHEIFTLRIKA